MSIKTVRAAIQKATADGAIDCQAGAHISGPEAKDIIAAAELNDKRTKKTPVTQGEIGEIVDFFQRQLLPRAPGSVFALACPESPNSVVMDADAISAFEAFFTRHDVVVGALKPAVEQAIKNGYGPSLAQAPNLDGLTYVFLRDSRMVDGPRLEAYVDVAKKEAYIKITGAGMAGPDTVGPFWRGPVKL